MTWIWIPVRCCCQPTKLLGWLEAPADARPGTVRRYMILERGSLSLNGPAAHFAQLTLPLALLNDHGRLELAFKSEETPIEVLRRVPGFIENYAVTARATAASS